VLHLRAVLAALPLLLACSGCVGICGGELPQLDRAEILRGERLPAISYEVEPPAGLDPWPLSENAELFRSAFVDARRGPATDDLHVQLSIRTEEDLHVLFIGLRVLWLFSLGIIPSYSQGQERLVARLEFKGRLLREYHYAERVKVWAHLFLLPAYYTRDNASLVLQRVHANMLLHLIRDLRQDLPALLQSQVERPRCALQRHPGELARVARVRDPELCDQ
jgi:hypothetical protein